MAHDDMYFGVENAPGPFRLVQNEVEACKPPTERNETKREVVEFTLIPIFEGEAILGSNDSFKLRFEVVLKGRTTKWGHSVDEPRNIRMLGRFLASSIVRNPVFDGLNFVGELTRLQWEVVFNPQTRQGAVWRLPEPLPEEWTR